MRHGGVDECQELLLCLDFVVEHFVRDIDDLDHDLLLFHLLGFGFDLGDFDMHVLELACWQIIRLGHHNFKYLVVEVRLASIYEVAQRHQALRQVGHVAALLVRLLVFSRIFLLCVLSEYLENGGVEDLLRYWRVAVLIDDSLDDFAEHLVDEV